MEEYRKNMYGGGFYGSTNNVFSYGSSDDDDSQTNPTQPGGVQGTPGGTTGGIPEGYTF